MNDIMNDFVGFHDGVEPKLDFILFFQGRRIRIET